MKKTHNYFWLLKPIGDFRKLLLTSKIVTLLFICGLALPAFSLASGSPSSGDQQQIKVTGRITDAGTGQPMPGVSIQIKGTAVGALSDVDGKYSIAVTDQNATLAFSFIGYVIQDIPLNGRLVLDVALESEVQKLQEVVVVGYGTVKKASLTGSISAVSGDELKMAPTTNLTNSLIGVVPGITARQTSGEPGNDETTIFIRGANTLGNTAPLIVVDGIPHRSLDRIDPADIESLTILKDASAAIYGTQAANGVILITTKRGSIGKPTITVNLNAGYNQPDVIPKMADAATYATCLNEVAYYAAPSLGRNQVYSAADIALFANGKDPWGHPNTNWFKAVFKPWSAQNYENVSINGGTENMKYFMSFGSKYQDAYYKNSATDFTQYDFRSNIDGKISKNITLSFDIAGRQEDRNYPTVSEGNIFRMLMRGKPTMQAWWPNGDPGPDIEYGYNSAVTVTNATGFNDARTYYMESNLRLVITIPGVKGLSVVANGSYDKIFNYQKEFDTPWTLYSWDGVTKDAQGIPVLVPNQRGFSAPQLTENWQDGVRKTYNALVQYENTINDNNHIKLMVGTEAQYGLNNYGTEFRKNFVSSIIPELFAGAADASMTCTGWADQNAHLSYFSRINYDYSQKYLAEVVMREDGSYMFKPGNQFGFFPGISLGWRISNEDFWKNNISFINDFKLRASWGRTGYDQIYYNGSLQEYQYMSTYSFNNENYVFGQSNNAKMLYENAVPNPGVTWEVANQENVGFDAGLLKKKLTLSADFFYNLRSRILWQATAVTPSTTGMTLPPENIGKVANQGFEVQASYHGTAGAFGYNLSANASYAHNKIVFNYDVPGIPSYQKSEGNPMNAQLAYQVIGVFKDAAAVAAYPHWAGAQPGDLIFKDVNHDGVINELDMVMDKKTALPTFIGGLSAGFTWKQFDLTMLFQGASGAIAYLNPESGDIGNYYESWVKNRWTPENTNASWPRCFNRSNEYWSPGYARNTFWEFSTDYIRLKTLEFGYNLPSSIDKKLNIEKFRVYVSGQNLLTLARIGEIDPEEDQGTSYPLQRVVNIGVTLTF
ncbi:MAG: TonB-dependent receptor [Bacteroidales bacterium]|jgi:TonB-linked SusC/RagA family outer membrane protein